MKNYLVVISDTVFCALSVFILFRFILSTFLSLGVAIALSLTLALLSALLFFKLFLTKNGKNDLKKREAKELKEMIIRLSFMRKASLLTFFQRVFKKVNVNAEIKNGRLYLADKDVVIFLHFDFDEVKKSDVIKHFNALANDEIGVIFSSNLSSEILDFISNFNGKIKTYNERDIYLLLKKVNVFPENDVCFFKEKEKKWDFSLLLNKKRAKNYFLFGVIFMLYSFIVPIKGYYVVVGAIFLILSLTVKLFGKNTPSSI